ncbi:MAG: hypothetical protein R3A80_02315 [Bdellovibrionota bacterium]
MKFLITTSPGLEEENAKEILELTGLEPEIQPGGVLVINSEMDAVYRILCGSFLSSRVLMPLGEFHAWEKEILYLETKKIPWETIIAEGETFVCDVHGRPDNCDYSAAQGLLKVKDAIVDRIREKRGSRPDVNKDNPTHQIEMLFWQGKAELSVDLSGEPLHRRAYRKQHGAAPLRESRAAAMLRMSGFLEKHYDYLIDPFCGSGTIPIEAAMMLRKIPPANKRYIPKKNFISNFSKDYLQTLTDLRAGILEECPTRILASDIDSSMIPKARRTAENAGVGKDIQFEVMDFEAIDYRVKAPMLLVSNPPYGERLDDEFEAKQNLAALGKKLKFESDVEKLVLLIPKGMEGAVGFKPSKKKAWKAGPLDLLAASYDLWKGPKKSKDNEK